MNEPVNRLVGEMPKIGIRPTIDGRLGGVMLRIPVYMHNIPEEKVFRPSAWTAFGALEPQGADFRACANFGPLYG